LKADSDLKNCVESGANQITGGSIARRIENYSKNGLRSMVIKLFWEQMRIMKKAAQAG
jgi:phosphoribosylaminoimidazole (AIR) synthetase